MPIRDTSWFRQPRLTRLPKRLTREDYKRASHRMVNRLSEIDGVRTIYQVGSVRHPGISDLDLLVVFDNEAVYPGNPVQGLRGNDRYLFRHNLYGCALKHFESVGQNSTFGCLEKLWGVDESHHSRSALTDSGRPKARQIALEYMIRLCVALRTQQEIQTLSVRDLLLHSSGLMVDLELLRVSSGPLFDLVATAIEWREVWFEGRPSHNDFSDWFSAFGLAATRFVQDLVQSEPLYTFAQPPLRTGRSLILRHGDEFRIESTGANIPGWLPVSARLRRSVRSRTGWTVVSVPMESNGPRDVVSRFDFLRRVSRYNERRLPHFIPSSQGLRLTESCGSDSQRRRPTI